MVKFRLMAVALTLFLTGCSGMDMALTKEQAQLDIKNTGVVLASLQTSNQYKPTYKPDIKWLDINRVSPEKKALKYNLKNRQFKKEDKENNFYLLSFDLEPGEYKVAGFYCDYHVPLLVYGKCFGYFNMLFKVIPGEVTYIGNLQATLFEHKKGEVRAGGMIPLIDQAITGFYSSTYKYKVVDDYDNDIELYKQIYPVLRNVDIKKNLSTHIE